MLLLVMEELPWAAGAKGAKSLDCMRGLFSGLLSTASEAGRLPSALVWAVGLRASGRLVSGPLLAPSRSTPLTDPGRELSG